MAELSAGTTLSHYLVESKLGAGGMGEVYLALDTTLDRKVALKILPRELATSQDRMRRFLVEAKAAAALNHPNVAHVYEIGEHHGTHFIAMEFVDGRTLREEMYQERPDLAALLRLLQQAAEGLARAHAAGVVHRDLKPDNIMVTRDGHAKVLDFGLAKLVEQPVPLSDIADVGTAMMPARSAVGTVMGTVGYMSPEQAQGKVGEIDHRSDIFSLGCILFEAATRRKPFEGDSSIKTLHNLVYEQPSPISDLNPSAPPGLQRIVGRCLAKDRAERYQSVTEVAIELKELRREIEGGARGRAGLSAAPPFSLRQHLSSTRRLVASIGRHKRAAAVSLLVLVSAVAGSGLYLRRQERGEQRSSASVPGIPQDSIAVLPFVDMSEAKDQGYFADGMCEELLNLLAKIPELKVAARTSSFSFKNKQVEIPEIARQLNVANVLEGSVRKSGDQLRITVQLIRAAEGYHVWSETYDRKMDDVFKIQDEIAGDVVRELKLKLLAAAPKVRTTNPKAYALYLQGKEFARQFTPEAFAKSDALFQQALEIDPRYVPAWSSLAVNYNAEAGMGLLSSEEGYARAREAAEKALSIDPDYAPAHTALGLYTMQTGNDLAGAARHLERALALDPTGIAVLSGCANLLSNLGRLDQALALHEEAVRDDPVSVQSLSNLGAAQCAVGRYDEAIASYRKVLRLKPGRGGAHAQLGMVLLQKGDAAAALAEIEQETNETWRLIGLPMAYCALGRAADADAARNALIAKYEKDWSYNIAYVYAFCGQSDKAFEWLDKAVAYKDAGLGEIVSQKLFARIYSDPRWLPFLHKIGRAPEQLAQIRFNVTLRP